MKIVRTGGLIVVERGVIPLSTQINKALVESLLQKVGGATTIAENNENQLVAFFPIGITMGSEQFGFGGSKESIDHIQGNIGEGWHVVISLGEEVAIEAAHETTQSIIIIGIIFTLLTAAVALFLGKWAARPIVKLATTAQAIGEGRLDTRTGVPSNDEIGSLAKSLNGMTKNLQETMTSRDELAIEVKQRKKAEEEKEKIIVELEKALEEIKSLSGILPICMHCKEIRDDKGYWNQLEKYISEHSEAQFSHSICEKCVKKYYPEV